MCNQAFYQRDTTQSVCVRSRVQGRLNDHSRASVVAVKWSLGRPVMVRCLNWEERREGEKKERKGRTSLHPAFNEPSWELEWQAHINSPVIHSLLIFFAGKELNHCHAENLRRT